MRCELEGGLGLDPAGWTIRLGGRNNVISPLDRDSPDMTLCGSDRPLLPHEQHPY
jgi:hypothetical protein